jgi:hypothetical protein
MKRLAGGCLCGHVRYAIELEQDDVADYCHAAPAAPRWWPGSR